MVLQYRRLEALSVSRPVSPSNHGSESETNARVSRDCNPGFQTLPGHWDNRSRDTASSRGCEAADTIPHRMRFVFTGPRSPTISVGEGYLTT